jgi:hypothetical protein
MLPQEVTWRYVHGNDFSTDRSTCKNVCSQFVKGEWFRTGIQTGSDFSNGRICNTSREYEMWQTWSKGHETGPDYLNHGVLLQR